MIREFHLSPRGRGGISCDSEGAFAGSVPILARTRRNGKNEWQPRDCDELSEATSAQYCLPVDISSKTGGLRVIAKALNEGDLARAQIATVLLGIPDPPELSKGASSRQRTIKLIRDLHWSGMLKWNPDEHPRWPAGAPNSQGGEFAPRGTDADAPSSADGAAGRDDSDDNNLESHNREGPYNDDVYRPGSGADHPAVIQAAAEWPSNGPPNEAAVCARFARLCVLLAPLLLSGDTPQRVPLHDHHIFPQQFRQYFKQRGIDIDQYTVTMDAPTHLEGVHGAGIDGLPGQWNKAWADFIARNPNATRRQIFDFAGELMKRYGISSSEIHPYGQFP